MESPSSAGNFIGNCGLLYKGASGCDASFHFWVEDGFWRWAYTIWRGATEESDILNAAPGILVGMFWTPEFDYFLLHKLHKFQI